MRACVRTVRVVDSFSVAVQRSVCPHARPLSHLVHCVPYSEDELYRGQCSDELRYHRLAAECKKESTPLVHIHSILAADIEKFSIIFIDAADGEFQ